MLMNKSIIHSFQTFISDPKPDLIYPDTTTTIAAPLLSVSVNRLSRILFYKESSREKSL